MLSKIEKLKAVLNGRFKTAAVANNNQAKISFVSCTIPALYSENTNHTMIPGVCFTGIEESFCLGMGGKLGDRYECPQDQKGVFLVQSEPIEDGPVTASHFASADDASCLRYPQPWPWKSYDKNNPTQPFSFGGGNTCGDPWLGWAPACKKNLRPLSESTNDTLAPKDLGDGRKGYPKMCGGEDYVLGPENPPIPVPYVIIYADTRSLTECERSTGTYGDGGGAVWDTPYSGCHVKPGPKGPPADGGVWRGYSERLKVFNPKYIAWAKQHMPQCLSVYCNVGADAQIDPLSRAALYCWARQSSDIPANCAAKNTPIVPGGNISCESEICADIMGAWNAASNGDPTPVAGSNEPSWSKLPWDIRRACEKLTGINKNGPTTASIVKAVEGDSPGGGMSAWDIRNKPKVRCSPGGPGPIDRVDGFVRWTKADGMPTTDPCYKTWVWMVRQNVTGRYQPISQGPDCWNCLVFLNPNTLGFTGSDHPMPKTREQVRELMEKLAQMGCPLDWIPRQGCGMEGYGF